MDLVTGFWNLDLGQHALYQSWFEYSKELVGSEHMVFVLWLGLAHSIPMYGLNLAYTLFTHLMPEASEKWRFLPGKRAKPSLVRKAIAYVTAFHLLAPFLAYAGFPYAVNRVGRDAFFYSRVPGVGEILASVFVCYAITDALFYWAHRLLHVGPLYRHIHKQHHEFTVSIGFAAQYAHPIELILGNVVPVMAGYILFKMHFAIWALWTFVAMAGTTTGHSGLWYPSKTMGFHDWHHSANIGNYGSMPFWDWLCGTDKHWRKRHTELERQFSSHQSSNDDATAATAVPIQARRSWLPPRL